MEKEEVLEVLMAAKAAWESFAAEPKPNKFGAAAPNKIEEIEYRIAKIHAGKFNRDFLYIYGQKKHSFPIHAGRPVTSLADARLAAEEQKEIVRKNDAERLAAYLARQPQ